MGLGIKHNDEDRAGGKPLDLATAIDEFYREFPQQRSQTFILNHQQFTSGHDAVDSFAPQVEALLQQHPDAGVKMPKSLAAGFFAGKLPASVNISGSMYNGSAETPVYGRFVIPAGEEFSARLLKSIFATGSEQSVGSFPAMPGKFNNTEMWQRYVLDHELGHALMVKVLDKQQMKTVSFGNRAECEADAYAMIRHFQRYGSDSEFPAFIRDLRNMNAVHKGDIVHWTPKAIDIVIAMNDKGKLANLTPQQSVALAGAIAQQAALSADAEENMGKAFAATRKILARKVAPADMGNQVMSILQSVCDIGANTKSAATLNACQRYAHRFKYALPAVEMRMTKTVEELTEIRDNRRAMMARKLTGEPVVTGLGRLFRDVMLDTQSGIKRPKPGNDNNGKKGPKIG